MPFKSTPFLGKIPVLEDFLPKSKVITDFKGFDRKEEVCVHCNVKYFIPVPHSSIDIDRPFLGLVRATAHNFIDDLSSSNSKLCAKAGTYLSSLADRHFHFSLEYLELESEYQRKYVETFAQSVRNNHVCDPDIYVPPNIRAEFNDAMDKYILSVKQHEISERKRRNDFLLRRAEQRRRTRRMYLEIRELQESAAAQNAYEIRPDDEFGFAEMTSFFFGVLSNPGKSPIGGSR